MTRPPPTESSLSALLQERAAALPDAVALLAPGRAPLSYAGLWQQVLRVAGALQAHGITPAARVGVVLPNGPEMATTVLGVAAAAACVPLNPAHRAEELRARLASAGARAIVVGGADAGPLRALAKDMRLTSIEVAGDPDLPAGQCVFGSPSAASASLSSLAAADDVALILHTSGTTAQPKVVALRHANMISSARSIAATLALQPDDRCLNVMPLFHIHGLVGALLSSLAAGASVVCTTGFDDRAFFDWVAQLAPSWYTAAPPIHHAVVAAGGRYRELAPRHRFRFVRSSSSPLPPATLAALEALTGAPVVEAYGMTEAAHEMASNPLAGPRKPGSVGVATGADIAIMGDAGELLANGATGEVVIRGPGVTAGYENDDHANAAAYVDGWFRTGDQGRFDADGYLYLTGRLKEIVNRGGEKVSPREVDEALLRHPDVTQAAAFAVPHPTLGEDLAAAVVLRAGARANESDLRRFLAGVLAPFKIPSAIVAVDAVPQDSAGKVRRHLLQDAFGHRAERAFVAPRSAVERSLAGIFGEVLDCGPVGVDDNFFALGGDSLRGAQVAARIQANHGIDFAVPQLFAHPTVAALATAVEGDIIAAERRARELAAAVAQMSDEDIARLLAEADVADRWNRN